MSGATLPFAFTANELMHMKFTPAPAHVLIEQGLCTPQCLCASHDTVCDCKCHGDYHGALYEAEVE